MSDESSDKTGERTGSAEGSTGEKLSLFSMALWGTDGSPEDVFGRSDWWSSCDREYGQQASGGRGRHQRRDPPRRRSRAPEALSSARRLRDRAGCGHPGLSTRGLVRHSHRGAAVTATARRAP